MLGQRLLSDLGVVAMMIACACASPEPQLRPAASDTTQHFPPPAPTIAQTPGPATATLPEGYSLSAPFYWGSMLEEGQRAVLRHGDVMIDTVDAGNGVTVGKDSLVFLQVQTDTTPLHMGTVTSYESFPTDFFLWTPSARRKLSDVVPYFDSYFSNPRITGDATMVYWGVARRDSTNALYAMRYHFRTGHLDSVALDRRDPLATDYRYHLGSPLQRGNEFLFDSVTVDATTWRVLRPAASSTPKQ